jgi:glycosyltransferase involved in cell wall biosynthesis
MQLSVLVCTRNRPHNIIPCLDSIVQALSNASPVDAEIVVIDNASTDDTPAILRAWAAKSPFPVNRPFEPKRGASYARNCGLRAARGDLLIWTDDDCRLAPDYVATALKYDAADVELVFRGGRVALGNPSDYPISITWRQEPRRWHVKKHRNRQLGGAFMGANMMMRRAMVDKIGLFDERFGAGSDIPAGEEIDYIYRAYAAGMMVEFAPDLVVYHHHGRKTIADARNIMCNYSIGSGAVLTKHAIRFPLKFANILLYAKNALLEILTGGKNRFMPQIGFSYRNLVACYAIGTTRFVSTSIRPFASRTRKTA